MVLLIPFCFRLSVEPIEVIEEIPDVSDLEQQVTPIILDEQKLAALNSLDPYLFPVSMLYLQQTIAAVCFIG
jgi:hypothetical protein